MDDYFLPPFALEVYDGRSSVAHHVVDWIFLMRKQSRQDVTTNRRQDLSVDRDGHVVGLQKS